MYKRRYLVILLALTFLFTGCATLQKKFVRQKKKVEKVSPIVTTQDYATDLRVDELYKQYFTYWKTWQGELIERMDASYKKRAECYRYLVESLDEMEKYLTGQKLEELKKLTSSIRNLEQDVNKSSLTKGEEYRIKDILEKTKRQIEKSFSYKDVKDELKKQATN